MSYSATWLRNEEVFAVLAEHGIGEARQRPWIERAIRDRRIVAYRAADPARDLFRLPHVVTWGIGRWEGDADNIRWSAVDTETEAEKPVIEIEAPGRTRAIDWFAIEVSATLLREILGDAAGQPAPPSALRLDAVAPGPKPTEAPPRRYVPPVEVCGEIIRAAGPGMTKGNIQEACKKEIPDLKPTDFRCAWGKYSTDEQRAQGRRRQN